MATLLTERPRTGTDTDRRTTDVARWTPIVRVRGCSMHPTLEHAQWLLTRPRAGRVGLGDVVVFTGRGGVRYVKRIVAGPGDLVELEAGRLFVNGQSYDGRPRAAGARIETWRVPEAHFFVVGDNLAQSDDSRVWRQPFVPVTRISGVAVCGRRSERQAITRRAAGGSSLVAADSRSGRTRAAASGAWTTRRIRGFVRFRTAAAPGSVSPCPPSAGASSVHVPDDEGLAMIAAGNGWLTRVARRAGQAMLLLCLAAGSTLTLADGNRGTVLSLGDSVVFGYIAQDGPAYVNADNFIGYPEILGTALRLDASNPSCPGETTAGFLSLTGADNGCRLYRSRFPLHESYASTQLDYALAYLGANKRKTRLVTLSLGANDGFLLIAACNNDPACIQANLPAALQAIFANLNTILSNLRATGFKGVLMVVNYYSTDYSDPAGTALTQALNQTLAAAAAVHHAVVADAFTAFQQAAAVAGGKTCLAGLLNGNPADQQTCDVHPSITGQRLLAKTVQATFNAVRRGDD